GHCLIPQLCDGRLELQKPPLYYWLIAAWCRCTGGPVDGFAVRLPAALSALAIIVTVLAIGYVSGKPRTGSLAASCLLLMPHFIWLSHVGRIDLPITACLTLALASWMLRQRKGERPVVRHLSLFLLGVMITCGLLLKGPIVLVLFILIIGGERLLSICCNNGSASTSLGRQHPFLNWPSVVSILILVGCAVPAFVWYILANEATEGFWVKEFFYRHNMARGFGGDPQLDRHRHWLGPLFYLAHLPLSAGPIMLVIPLLVRKFSHRFLQDSLLRLALCWFTVPVIFLSLLSYKRLDYLAPAYPGLALFLAATVMHIWETWSRKQRFYWVLAYSVAVILNTSAWLTCVAWVLPILDVQRQQRDFAALVRQHIPQGDTVLMFATEAHLLSYHLGGPIQRSYQESELRQWLQPMHETYVIVPQRYYDKLQRALESDWLCQRVATNLGKEVPAWFQWLDFDRGEHLLLVRVSRQSTSPTRTP
ncbi:MAG: glycosyltransferase family 39 protein, partial [Gemmatales bacterium]|nr:glycosyltransferase family 39 protein [Gemmatales bacterium]MDW8176453.1 glycosyltransferase family 39 protein [Gemmatales bacterium]